MKKTFYIVGTLAVALIVSAYFLFAKRDSHKYDFRFDKVSKGDLMAYVTATGTINAVISVDVGTQVSGIVSNIYADFNSVVKEGQVIAQIDSTFLVQSVKDAEASLERSKAQYADSKRNLDRTTDLYKKGLESELNYSAALTTFESNQAGLKQAQAALDRAKINLAYATIYAPINGVVIDRKVNIGQTVAASFSSPTLFTIANDLRRMQVQTTVDESDVGRVSIGQEATFTVDAYADEKFTGRVSQIRLAPQSIQNVVNYIVIIDVQNDELKLMPGMTANVKILVASALDVLRVSNMALRFQPPSDLIDTTAMNAMRSGFGQRAEPNADTSRPGQPAVTTQGNAGGAPRGQGGMERGQGGQRMGGENQGGANFGGGNFAGGGGFQRSPEMMQRMQAIRDSIQKAHGGNLSQEDLRAEMRKMFAGRMSGQNQQMQQQPKPQPKVTTKDAAKFGIQSNYPEYQKSAYVPSHQSGRGRVWILKANGTLEPIFVRTGLNDGRYTEITTGRLNPGDQVILGVSSADNGSDQTRSPLTGQGQRMGGPGGGGFR